MDNNGKVLEINQSFSSLLSNEDNTNKDKIICITTYEKYNKLNLDNNQ